MGIWQERYQALKTALQQLPKRTRYLKARWQRGNPEITRWLNDVRTAGRQPLFIVMIERLGDIVACTPIARQLKARQPDLAIAWVCSARYASLLEGNPAIDRVFHEECLASWLLTKRHLPQPFSCHELVLDSQRCCWTGIKLPGRHSGITRHNYLDPGSNLLIAYSRAGGIGNIEDSEPEVHTSAPIINLPKALADKPLLALHFDSEDPERRLSQEAAVAYGREALRRGWGVIELGLSPLASVSNPEIFFPGSGIPLSAHIELLRKSSHFAGVDSGFMHCANALDKPATVFIGKFREFSRPQTFSGSRWKNHWDSVHGPWTARDCPTEIVLAHLPNP